ncbi:hypothetical protein PybrP1_000063 [[Pythium] brassicae (nom. inval.)]|nr:hypothetical protein PybrP1_000063 [[Pythium] brassicae (nom. inval.)]
MGTTASHHSSNSKATEWKGPFSDQEYECLVQKFELVASASSSASDTRAKLQSLFQVPLSASLAAETSADRIQQLGAAFYDLCLYTREAEARESQSAKLQRIDFVQAVAACVRSSSQVVMRSLFRLFAAKGGAVATEDELVQLLLAVLIMADETQSSGDAATLQVAKRLAAAALPADAPSSGGAPATAHQLSCDEFVRWASAQFPLLYSIFVSWMSAKCFGAIARPSYHPPRLSHKSEILSSAHFVCLSAVATPTQNALHRLYTSSQDGLSFNRLSFHLLGYTGPTLVVIRDTDGAVFGMFCDSEWKESTRAYGGNGCFLFRFEPAISVYRVTGAASSDGVMYLNSKGFALPRGLGMGGTTSQFRLFLSEDLDESSYTTTKGLAFEGGRLSGRDNFTIDALEVWGCGDDADVARQSAFRQDAAELITRARKVDKAQFVGSDFDKEMFLGKTFGHGTDQARVADDER